MDHREAFRRAIVENPDDIEFRLVFADWLEEHGDPRGRFIRAEIQLAETDEADVEKRDDIEKTIEDLLGHYGQEWVNEDLGSKCRTLFAGFNLGFVDAIALSANRFLSTGDAIFRRAPVRCVRLYEARHAMRQLAACPLLQRLRGISFRGYGNQFGSEGLEELLASPHLINLRWLDLRDTAIGVEAVLALARWLGADKLESLSLSSNRIGGGGLPFLLGSEGLAGLHRLDLASCGLGNADVEALAASAKLAGVRSLNLADNEFESLGAAALGRSPHLHNLRRLDLWWNRRLDDHSLAAILGNESLRNLAVLDASNCGQLEEEGVRSIFVDGHCRNLRIVSLADDQITADALATIEDTTLENLYVLNLSRNPIGDEGASRLATCPALKSLRYLNISYCRITDSGVRAIAAGLPELRGLRLAGNQITEEAVACLLESPMRLEQLDLSYCRLTENGIIRLLRHPWSRDLRYLSQDLRRIHDRPSAAFSRLTPASRTAWEAMATPVEGRPLPVHMEDESRDRTPQGEPLQFRSGELADIDLVREAFSVPMAPSGVESDPHR